MKNANARTLKDYKKKRDFTKSPEPKGTIKRSAKALFFCVQKHLASHLHYDLRLEHNGVLLSWAVPKGPSLDPQMKRLAIQVEDHPRDYGSFEGVIPSGYGAGIVLLWDRGTWTPHGDVDASLEKGHLSFELQGKKLKGVFALQRMQFGGGKPQWLLFKKTDEYATNDEILDEAQSVKSKKDFAEIVRGRVPEEWTASPPARGGDAGALFKTVLRTAARGRK
jgi:bifunctional non-homologous end joining protein LigD